MRGATTRQPGAGPTITDWAPGPAQPQLGPGAVHVWRVDLGAVSEDVLALLSPSERARAKRIAGAGHAQAWGYGRGVLRALLGRYLPTDPAPLRIATTRTGKPYLEHHAADDAGADPISSELSFNLAHSAQTAVYAFTLIGAIGVDVELARRPLDALALAERAFGPVEAARLRTLDRATRDREFVRAWVRHEATLKCLGVGLGGAETQNGASAPWSSELDVGPGAGAAVAVVAAPRELYCWDWSGRPERGSDPPTVR